MSAKQILIIFAGFLLVMEAPAESFFNRDLSLIASSVAQSLRTRHLAHELRQSSLSSNFLANFIETLDGNRDLFLQSDVEELKGKYNRNLEPLTFEGDLRPANEILGIWLARLRERETTIQELLKEPWEFDTNESIPIPGMKSSWPFSRDEARSLWRLKLKSELLDEMLNGLDGRELVKTVSQRHRRLLEEAQDARGEQRLKLYLDALAHAYDPHSEFLPASELESLLHRDKSGGYGVGVVLEVKDGFPFVKEMMPGGPAARDGHLGIGDRIVRVGQADRPMMDVVHLKLNRIADIMNDSPHSDIRLSTIPAHAPNAACRRPIELKRVVLQNWTPQTRALLCALGKIRVGTIRLPSFFVDLEKGEEGGAAAEVRRLLQQLKREGIEGLILDLRGNRGGNLPEAIAVAGLFIKEGPLVQATSGEGGIETLSVKGRPPLEYDGPLVVLVDHFTASASEIVAAALQDHGRAVIVGGARTFGKGTIQRLNDLGLEGSPAARLGVKAGALKLTIQQFHRVLGEPIQGQGVVPDIQIPSLQDCYEKGEAALKRVLPAERATALSWTNLKQVEPWLTELRTRSKERVNGLPLFAGIKKEIEQSKAQSQETEWSLNQPRRLQQLQDWVAKTNAAVAREDSTAAAKWQITPIETSPDEDKGGASDAGAFDGTDMTLQEALSVVEDLAEHVRGRKGL